MKQCPNCSKGLVSGANFCHGCGGMIRPFCRPCKIALPGDAAFCFHCGDPLHQLAVPHAVPGTYLSQGREDSSDSTVAPSSVDARGIMPSDIREKFEKAQSAIEGERKLVSVLFADISGFTAMSEKLDPEQVSDRMNACFQRLGSVVFEFEGYIDKFIGDCIMALFGAPIAHENDPQLAVRCGLKMLEALETFNHENNLDLGLRIGINSGMVIAGGVGTNEKLDFTVMGDAVNVAQRLESAAERNQILVSRTIAKSCEREVEFRALEPLQVKGKEQKLEVYSVVGWKKRNLQERSLQAGYSPLIGRDEEVRLAHKVLAEAQEGRGQILLLFGEAGVGKSRLRHEIRKDALRADFRWFEVKCQSLTASSPLFVFRHLVSKMMGIDPDAALEDQLHAFSSFEMIALEDVTRNFLKELLGLYSEDSPLKELSSEQKRRGLFMAVKQLVTAYSQRFRTFLWVDDLQWMDDVSKSFFEDLLDLVPTRCLVIGGGSRPEFKHDWHQKRTYQQISLHPLPKEKAIDMAKAILQIQKLPSELEQLLLERAEGNPLYVEEIIKSLVDARKIVRQEAGWEVSEDLEGVEIPATLQGLIASRIDRLDAMDKKILQMGAVIGRQFSDLLLGAALEDEADLFRSLQFLRKKELIFEAASSDREINFVFNHILTQEVAYQSILLKKRKAFHEQVGEAIERLIKQGYYTTQRDHLESLAHHFTEAKNVEKSIFYLREAASQMRENFDNNAAIRLYRKAIEQIETIRPGSLELAETRALLAEVCTLIGDYQTSDQEHHRIIEVAEGTESKNLEVLSYRRLGDNARLRGDIASAKDYLQKALAVAEETNDQEATLRTYKSLANVLKMTNDVTLAFDYYQEGLRGAKKLGQRKLEAEFLNDLGTLYIAQNILDKAEACLLESQQVAEEENFKMLQVNATINRGAIAYYRNAFQEALDCFEKAAHLSGQIGDLQNVMLCEHNRGAVAFQFEKFDDAEAAFRSSLLIAKDLGSDWDRVNNELYLAYCQTRRAEDSEEGLCALQNAVEESEERGFERFFCFGKFLLGRVYFDREEQEQSAQFLTQALTKAKEIQDPLLIKEIQEFQAKLSPDKVQSQREKSS